MKTFLLFLVFAFTAAGANYNCTSTGTGDFNAAGTWASCNSTYPNNSTDTFTFSIGATHVVTLPSGAEATVGQSLAANTAQGTVANTGKIVLAADLTGVDPTILTMKGDLAITTVTASCTLDGATNCNGVEMNPGTVLLIDSDGSGTSYAIGQTAGGNSRWFKADCTDATSMPAWAVGTTYGIGWRVSYNGVNYISVANSNTGNTPHLFDSAYWQRGNCAILSIGATNAVFSRRGFSFGGGNVYFRYVAMRNFGAAAVDAITTTPQSTNNPNGGGDITHSSFHACGSVDLDDGERTGSSIHRFNENIVITADSGFVGVRFHTSTTALTTGIREFKGNVMLRSIFGLANTLCSSCTVEGNYVDHSVTNTAGFNWTQATAGHPLLAVRSNFVLKNNTTQSGILTNANVIEYNYIVNGPAINNQNTINLTNATVAGNNPVARYNMAALLNGDTVGDTYVITQTSGGLTVEYSRNSQELNRDNATMGNLITWLGVGSPGGTDAQVYRNNFISGTTYAVAAETSYHGAGLLTVQNNTFARHNSTGTMSKVLDTASCTTNPNDICTAANCNYNLGVDLSVSTPGGCTNAHNFYIMDLSAGTGWGANDTNLSTVAEAMFVDLTRTFATAATDFFGESATAGAWSNASVSYAVGDIVSDSQSIWQGKTVLYRALAAHTSADTSRPGNGATWQTACGGGPCWEYATAYFIRDKIARGVRITDASIGASDDYVPKAMALWALYGRMSHRRDLQCKGSDGESPWPIPYCERGRTVAAAIMGY